MLCAFDLIANISLHISLLQEKKNRLKLKAYKIEMRRQDLKTRQNRVLGP